MIILCKTVPGTKNIPVSQLINRIGKYLKKTIGGAYSMKIGVNECTVNIVVYYQVPYLPDKPGGELTYSDLKEMSYSLNMTTYANKLRVNLIEISPEEQTLGHFVLPEDKIQDMLQARSLILGKVTSILNKTFQGYEFVF